MSNIHSFPGITQPAKGQKKKRGSYRKKASKAEIARAIQTAKDLGLTVYGYVVEGEKVHVQTQPFSTSTDNQTAVDAWFNRDA